MSHTCKTTCDSYTSSKIQHRICYRKAIKNHVKIFERIIKGVTFQMKTCSSHVEEYSEDGKEKL